MPASRLRTILAATLLAGVVALGASAPVAAADPPSAAFTFTVDGLRATFTDTSTGEPTTWTWDFGDGTASNAQNPVHTFEPGRWRVRLTVENADGNDSTSHTVTIKEPPPDQLYSDNLYSSLVRYQDPDMSSCVAAATLIMLNEVATHGHRGSGFRWTTSTSLARQRSIMKWARAHDTLEAGAGGSDPNGWRNALNQYGWADYQDPGSMTYQVQTFTSYTAAVKAAVRAVARFHRPVGLLGWAGGHAQVLNGYSVYGQDPATSSSFTVRYVYLTDPLKRDALRNARITFTNFVTGPLKYRLRKYRQTDSPKDDPYTPGVVQADNGWYGRYVIVAPVR